MVVSRFDHWTRTFEKLRGRRVALTELAGAGFALATLARANPVAASCRLSGEGYSRSSQCCSLVCKGTPGTCRCLGTGASCGNHPACCSGICDETNRVCYVGRNSRCRMSTDCCSGRVCKTDSQGNRFCK